jgi:hypothetical protein
VVYFTLTRSGYEDLVSTLGHAPSPLWVNNGVLSPQEIKSLYERGVDITNFTIDVNPEDQSAVAQAIETVREHHPGQTVWVEYVAGL